MECFGTTDFDNNSRLITLSTIIISGLHCIWIWKQQGWEVDPEIDGKMKWGRTEDFLVEKGGRKGYITERNGRSSWERQGIVAFCTCQRNEYIYIYISCPLFSWQVTFLWIKSKCTKFIHTCACVRKNTASLSNVSIAGWWVCGSLAKASTIAYRCRKLTITKNIRLQVLMTRSVQIF